MRRFVVEKGCGTAHNSWIIKDRTSKNPIGMVREIAGAQTEKSANYIAELMNHAERFTRKI